MFVGNGTVGVVDLMILNEWLGSDDPDCCIADLNVDGVIGLIRPVRPDYPVHVIVMS